MNEMKCAECLFFDICAPKYGCQGYTPIDTESDEYIDTYIEDRRREYYQEWFLYTED